MRQILTDKELSQALSETAAYGLIAGGAVAGADPGTCCFVQAAKNSVTAPWLSPELSALARDFDTFMHAHTFGYEKRLSPDELLSFYYERMTR